MIKPRDYQVAARESIWKYFRDGKTGNPLVAMPTGTGKSIVIGDFLQSVYTHYPMQKIMVLTHVKELIQQNYEKLIMMWTNAPAGIYSAGLKRREANDSITFAGIGSVAKRADEFGFVDLLIIDEAHLVSPNEGTMYQKFIKALKKFNPHLKIIGFTATTYRLKQGSLIEEDGLFTDICFDLTTPESFNWLIQEGYLMPLVPKKTTSELEVDGVTKRGGEFVAKDLQLAVDREEITFAALKEAIELGHDRHSWLVFTTGIEHAIHTNDMLISFGIDSEVVHSGNKDYPMLPGQRDETLRKLKAGEIRAVVNNNVLTTGFDHPAIDFIIMLRPSASAGLWVQMLGRGTRPMYAEGFDLTTREGRIQAIEASQKQNCLVADFAGNTRRLGPINDPMLPTKRGKKKGGEAPVKVCDSCDCYVHASVRICEYCGFEFHFATHLNETAATDELIKADLPVVESFKIDHITYGLHHKAGKPDSMKVSYYAEYQMFTEYVCLGHGGFMQKKAEKWWEVRATYKRALEGESLDDDEAVETPSTVKRAIELASARIATPTHLRVWINKKYPEIMDYCFDGTDFGQTDEIADSPTAVSIADNSANPVVDVADFVDDIPF